jgi:excinuclease ABC subunit A
VFLSKYRGYTLCPACSGARLRLEARLVRVAGKTLPEICAMTASEAAAFFDSITLDEASMVIAGRLLHEIRSRLKFLIDVGLVYLTLDRLASTL